MVIIMDKNYIETYVTKLLQEQDIAISKNIKIVSLANKLGFVVGIANLPSEIQGVIAYDDTGTKPQLGTQHSKIIAINSNLDSKDKRFIIAHELGHYFLSPRSSLPVQHQEFRIDKHGKNETENEMDYFAACLLMPKSIYLDSINSVLQNMSIESFSSDSEKNHAAKILSDEYLVPFGAARRRIDEVLENEPAANF